MSALLVVILVGCTTPKEEAEGNDKSILLSRLSISFTDVGEVAEITAVAIINGEQIDSVISDAQIEWTTSDESVATVENGVVTAVGYGTCSIRATYEGASAVCTVKNPNPLPPLTISKTEIVLENIGVKETIIATDDSGVDISSKISWSSSNESIATCVDGEIVARGYGSCTVTAKSQSKTSVCIVTVNNPTAPAVSVSQDRIELSSQGTYTLSAKIKNEAGMAVIWKSTDPSVATCEGGVVSAKSDGQCAIIAMTELGYADVCIVTVGAGASRIEHADYLRFDFPNIGKELRCIDKATGKVVTTSVVIGYKMKTMLLSDGRLVVETSLICVKTYDKDGKEGINPTMITATLYRENDVFCDKKQYKKGGVAVGEQFEIKCSGFTVSTRTDGTARELYMTFSSITEK